MMLVYKQNIKNYNTSLPLQTNSDLIQWAKYILS